MTPCPVCDEASVVDESGCCIHCGYYRGEATAPVHDGSYIDYYAEPLGHGRAIMRCDVVIDGELVESHTEGSPAPLATVEAHARRVRLGQGAPWRSPDA